MALKLCDEGQREQEKDDALKNLYERCCAMAQLVQ
ncbi:hypothetical protein QG37_07511 [Candidozyma auris]|uniref:Uncharacterized protein n=1 Tax=Candidozyma auris TaxID=498019 RepID=A0A0L0NPQ9_CANAR|nr:hypothetical protein QG37_07511 [[Candida] auris]